MGRDDLSEQNLLLLDGNSLINRAFFGLYGRHNLTAPDGMPTGALFAFFNMYLKFIDDIKPTHVVAAFDRPEPTFRHLQYDQYKGTRKGMPDDLAVQMPWLKQVLAAWGVACVELSGFEADDIIGTLAVVGSKQMPVSVITGDKDSFQLASDRVTILQPVTRTGKTDIERYDPEAIRARYTIGPEQIIDLKALMGDSSDNIPGVRGIGEKSAMELISRYGSLDGVYQALDEIRPTLAEKLRNSKTEAYLSQKLATINLEVPIDTELDQFRLKDPDPVLLPNLLMQLGFKSLINRLNLVRSAADPQQSGEKDCLEGDLDRLRRDLSEQADPWPAIWIEGDGSLYWQSGDKPVCRLTERTLADGWAVIEASGRVPVFYDYKDLLRRTDLSALSSGVHDVLIAAYLLNQLEGRPDLERLYQQATGEVFPDGQEAPDASTSPGKAKATKAAKAAKTAKAAPDQQTELTLMPANDETAEIPDQEAQAVRDRRAMIRTRSLRIIALKQRQDIEDRKMGQLADEIEFPLAAVLAGMEKHGFALDIQALQTLGQEMADRQEVLQKEIYALCGKSFNLNSPKQLGEVLFVDLGLVPGKKGSAGAYSTDIEELERLSDEHPAIPMIIEYRQTAKLRTTYIEGLMRVADPVDNRVHTTFNQTLTSTGRLSSTEPNLQNIPIRMEAGQKIRRAFIAGPGMILLDADYSQIELRLLAHLSGDPAMVEAFVQNGDIHMNTATRIFDKPAEAITSAMRSIAKTMNFSIVYGISDFGLARDLGVTVKQAHHYIAEYEQEYPRIRPYLNSLVQQAYDLGYVETLFGRRRYMNELKSPNRSVRQFGERAAMNTPVQGTAADLIKIAMVRVDRALKSAGLAAHLILQVHDELIVEAPLAEADRAAVILKHEMEHAMQLSVPLLAEVHQGSSWADCK